MNENKNFLLQFFRFLIFEYKTTVIFTTLLKDTVTLITNLRLLRQIQIKLKKNLFDQLTQLPNLIINLHFLGQKILSSKAFKFKTSFASKYLF